MRRSCSANRLHLTDQAAYLFISCSDAGSSCTRSTEIITKWHSTAQGHAPSSTATLLNQLICLPSCCPGCPSCSSCPRCCPPAVPGVSGVAPAVPAVSGVAPRSCPRCCPSWTQLSQVLPQLSQVLPQLSQVSQLSQVLPSVVPGVALLSQCCPSCPAGVAPVVPGAPQCCSSCPAVLPPSYPSWKPSFVGANAGPLQAQHNTINNPNLNIKRGERAAWASRKQRDHEGQFRHTCSCPLLRVSSHACNVIGWVLCIRTSSGLVGNCKGLDWG